MITISSNNLKNYKISDVNKKYNVNYTKILRYYISISHNILGFHKEISAPELFILQDKVDSVVNDWDKKYADYLVKEEITSAKDFADKETIEASNKQLILKNILNHTLTVDDRIHFDSLKDKTKFKKPLPFKVRPLKSYVGDKPVFIEPKIGFFDIIFNQKQKKIEFSKLEFEKKSIIWNEKELKAKKEHELALDKWNSEKNDYDNAWKLKEEEFYAIQNEENLKIDELASRFKIGEYSAVVEHATMVLEKSNYFDIFQKSFEVEYNEANKTLLIEYDLPSIDKLPNIKKVTFDKITGEYKEFFISEKEQRTNFDSVCYQICLRTIHEMFEADEFNSINSVLFNGFTNYIDKAKGKELRVNIISILVSKDEFNSIDLSKIEPKACFKSLKGVAASSLSSFTPIPPIMEIDKSDRRFVDANETIKYVDETTNLAAMDWEDFEHLVREVFEKEFASRGGEVKITQASNDGGVDAIAFDPDPITGGKIVIQAKRYTNTVGVSAVRDLYGTVQHEGASKGILVTTSDFGPDAYKFASDKPLNLMSGSNLLYLLEKHGHKAKIDIIEAKKMLGLTK